MGVAQRAVKGFATATQEKDVEHGEHERGSPSTHEVVFPVVMTRGDSRRDENPPVASV